MEITVDDTTYEISGGHYENGRIAIQLVDRAKGDTKTPTLNITDYRDTALIEFSTSHNQKAQDLIFLKTHSEAAGIAEALEKEGLIVRSGAAIPKQTMTGIEICWITPKARKELPWDKETEARPQ